MAIITTCGIYCIMLKSNMVALKEILDTVDEIRRGKSLLKNVESTDKFGVNIFPGMNVVVNKMEELPLNILVDFRTISAVDFLVSSPSSASLLSSSITRILEPSITGGLAVTRLFDIGAPLSSTSMTEVSSMLENAFLSSSLSLASSPSLALFGFHADNATWAPTNSTKQRHPSTHCFTHGEAVLRSTFPTVLPPQ